MSLSLPTPIFQQQPAFLAGIAQGHPLARNLRFAGYSASGRFYDAVSRQASTQGSTANRAARRTIDGNLGLAFEAKTTQMTFPIFSTGFDQVAGPCTIFVEGSVLTNNTSQNVAESFASGSGDGFGLKFDDNNQVTNGFYSFINNSNSTPSNFDVLGVNSETFRHRIMYTLDGVNAKLYAKGKLDVSAANTNLPTADTTRQTRILTGTGGDLSLVLVWDRALTLEEFQQLFFNPWQVFLAPRKRFTLKGIAGFAQSLTGVFFGSLEKDIAGRVDFSTVITGDNVKSSEKNNTSSLAVGAVALAGSNVKSAEKDNQSSISSLPYTAAWTELFGTNFSSVVPSPVPAPGGTSWVNAMVTWSTGAFGAGYFIIARQGGHTDYSGNECYGLRISDNTPLLLRNPCSAAIIAASDSIESSGLYATSTSGTTPDPQEPRSTHGYSTHVWSTVKAKLACLGASGMYPSGQLGNVTIRYYDPVANNWETGPDILTPFNAAYSASCEDANGDLWFIGQGTGGRLNRINVTTGVVTEFGNAFMHSLQSYYRTGIHDPVNNFFWIFGGDGTSMEIGYWDLNNTSGFIDFTAVTPTGPTTILKQSAPGVAWYPGDSKIVLWSGGTTVCVFDPITHICSNVTLNSSSTATPTSAQPDGTYGRFRAINEDTFLCVNSMTENFYQLHLSGPSAALTGGNSGSSEKDNLGTVAPGSVSLAGEKILSKEQEFLASVTIATSGLSGQSISSDFRDFSGTLSTIYAVIGSFITSAEKNNQNTINALIALIGQFGSSLEKFNSSSIAAIISLLGQTIPSAEKDNPGNATPGGVTLSGQSIDSLEKAFPGTIASIIALTGQAVASMERPQTAILTTAITLVSQFTPSGETPRLGSVAVGAVNLSGQNITSQEKFYQSVIGLAGVILSGIFTPSAERQNVGTIAPGTVSITGLFLPTMEQTFLASVTLAGALVGVNILSMEKFQQAVLTLGAVSLSGSNSKSMEKDNIGLLNTGLSVAGSFSKEMEKSFAASVTNLLTMLGSGIKSDEQFKAAVISTLRSLAGANVASMERDGAGTVQALYNVLGQNIPSMEKKPLAAITPGGVTLLGANALSQEKDNAGSLGTVTTLNGAFSLSQEQELAGVVKHVRNLLGDHIDSLEHTSLSILSVGAAQIVGQFIPSGELIRVSVILNGGILDTVDVINAEAPFETDLIADAPFETDLIAEVEFV